MGIISTLLTGGSILGKVCQMISESGIVKSVNCADGSEIMLRAAKTEINGVRFTEIVKNDKTMLHAFNTDVDMYACITYPNGYGKTNGFQIFIPPMGNEDLELGEWQALSPDLPIYVQKIDLSEGAQIENNRVIVAFNGLELNEKILEMPNTHITATPIELKISFATTSLGDLASAEFRSESGVRSTLRDPIQVVKKGLTETSYEIPFDALGFTKNDILSGMMQFNIDKVAALTIKEKADKFHAEHELKEISAIMRDICGIASK